MADLSPDRGPGAIAMPALGILEQLVQLKTVQALRAPEKGFLARAWVEVYAPAVWRAEGWPPMPKSLPPPPVEPSR